MPLRGGGVLYSRHNNLDGGGEGYRYRMQLWSKTEITNNLPCLAIIRRWPSPPVSHRQEITATVLKQGDDDVQQAYVLPQLHEDSSWWRGKWGRV